jgi:hypothetical protein
MSLSPPIKLAFRNDDYSAAFYINGNCVASANRDDNADAIDELQAMFDAFASALGVEADELLDDE